MKKTFEATYHRSCQKSYLILHNPLSLLPFPRVPRGPFLIEQSRYRLAPFHHRRHLYPGLTIAWLWDGRDPSTQEASLFITARAVCRLRLELNIRRRSPYSLCHVQPCGLADRNRLPATVGAPPAFAHHL